MSEKYFRGKITFINNDSQKATIEYTSNNKTIDGQLRISAVHCVFVLLLFAAKKHMMLEHCRQ